MTFHRGSCVGGSYCCLDAWRPIEWGPPQHGHSSKGPAPAHSCQAAQPPVSQSLTGPKACSLQDCNTFAPTRPATAILFSGEIPTLDCPQAFPKLHQGLQAPSRETTSNLPFCPPSRQTTLDRQYLRKWCVTTPIPNFCEALGGNWAAGVLLLQRSPPPPPADRD